ncbi:MAG: hypothetical protein HQM02_10805, partial [Magnetococcales bacterium]|nr:hypothetical protein [Magnetococcales bacterium]
MSGSISTSQTAVQASREATPYVAETLVASDGIANFSVLETSPDFMRIDQKNLANRTFGTTSPGFDPLASSVKMKLANLKGATGSPGASGAGSGDVNKAVGASAVDEIVAFGNTSGDLLKLTGIPAKSISTTVTSASSSAGAIVLDMSLGAVFTTTLTEDITSVTISNVTTSGICGTVTWIFTQDATSAKTVTLPAGGVWATGSAPDFSTLGGVYMLVFKTTNAGSSWVVSSAGGGGGVSGLTTDGVVIGGGDGKAAQSPNFVYKSATDRMGIGTDSPTGRLSVLVSGTSP